MGCADLHPIRFGNGDGSSVSGGGGCVENSSSQPLWDSYGSLVKAEAVPEGYLRELAGQAK